MTKTARADVLAATAWWRRHRDRAPRLLEEELQRALAKIAATPWVGVAVPDETIQSLRRVTLVRTRYLLFFSVDEAAGEVTVLRLWHGSRGRAPKL